MQMRNNGAWLPIVASVGVGAATYYSLTKGGKSLSNTLQQMVPFVSSIGGTQIGGQQQSSFQQTQPSQGTQSSTSTPSTYQDDELSIH
ncbi:MAG TPA: hypothetical protein VFK27_06890 [Bacillales bacterium]|jgi:hypothetical protein|nr:hypothetical protein [Bacillales bacterium]